MPNPFDKSATATAEAPAAEAEQAPAKAAPRNGTKAKAGKPAAGDGFDTTDADGEHKPGKSGDPFSVPSSGTSEYKITQLLGSLMLVKPSEVIEEMDTESGHAENVIRADVTVLEDTEVQELGPDGKLTGRGTGEMLDPGYTVEDVLVFNLALKRALLRVFEGPNPFLLGRLAMGNAKKGKNAPFIFERPDEDDVTLARQYLASIS